MKEMINPCESALFILLEKACRKHLTVGQKLLLIKTVNISIQVWHREGGITQGDSAWLRLAHQIEELVVHCPSRVWWFRTRRD